MKNFGLIFQYEIKKITHRKLWLIAFAAILLFTILLNLYTIFDFSVGWSGAQVLKANKNNDGLVIDKSAFFNGIPIYYVNDSDELVEEKVSPLKYIQMQRQFAMEWSVIDQGDRSAGLLSGVVGSIRVPSGTHSQM